MTLSGLMERREVAAAIGAGPSREALVHLAAVVAGTVMIVIAAFNQPYNQNEFRQMTPYGSDTIDGITSGTRQPPLDPLLGALVQRLFGIGQLQQRLVPVLAGIGVLVVMSLLLRRLRTGIGGSVAIWFLATSPLLIRYSAYTRPYATPLFLMVLFVYAGHRWLEDRRPGWLVVAALSAAALPATRVPEPTVFLVVAPATLLTFSLVGRLQWARTLPLAAVCGGALLLVGYPMYKSLSEQSAGLYDPSPAGVADRFDTGVTELLRTWLPLAADWFPWWPLTVALLLLAVVLPGVRNRLASWWMFWPLLAAPVAFVIAYHFVNSYPLDVRPYRPRFFVFFVPAHVLLVTALAMFAAGAESAATRIRQTVAVVLAVALLGQLPATARVTFENEAPDFEQASTAIMELPPDAIVLYETPSPVGMWHQPFSGVNRYMGEDARYVGYLGKLVIDPSSLPERGPVYMLMLDSECAYSVVCDLEPATWDGNVPGWSVKERFDRFTLYEPDRRLHGTQGVIEALTDFGRSLGPDYGYFAVFLAARLLKDEGRGPRGRALIAEMYAEAGPEKARAIHKWMKRKNRNPFDESPVPPNQDRERR
ncbi:MAG TPA: glycosyltransferase family 39 protein [Nocardioidaceae bacterium]